MTGSVVSDSSPLIALERIESLSLLQRLMSTVAIPHAVDREVFATQRRPTWIEVVPLSHPPDARLHERLGQGELEAIQLAIELEARWLILDDLPARRLAASSTLPVIGTAGLLLSAKKAGLIDAVEPKLHRLIHEGFRLSDTVVFAVLKAAGEAPACNPE